MIKVCHMTSVHNRYDIRIFHKECKSLAAGGYAVTLLVNDNKPNENIQGVAIVSTGYTPESKLKRIINSQGAFFKKALEIDADIYHFHDPELLPVGLRLKKRGKRVIFDSHEFYREQIMYKEAIPMALRSLIASAYGRYEGRVLRSIDGVIYPCTIDSGAHNNGIMAKNIVYINNVPKNEEFYDRYSSSEQKQGFKLCHVGSLTYNRGIVFDLKAAHRAGVPLILAGNFESKELEDQVKGMTEASALDYRGYADREQVLKIYQESSVGVSTLLNRGQYYKINNLPTKVYEYMSMALPVIISDTPYAKEVLEEYKFGIAVNPEDPEDIAKAIEYLKNHPEEAKAMGEEGRRAVREKFSWQKEEEKLLKLYKQLVSYEGQA